jgi:hypothetical protein
MSMTDATIDGLDSIARRGPNLGSDPHTQLPVGACVRAVSPIRYINLGGARVIVERSLQGPESPRRMVDVGGRWPATSRMKIPKRDGNAQCFPIVHREGRFSRRPIRQQGVRSRNQVPIITGPAETP